MKHQTLPATLWVMAFNTNTPLGSISHVNHNDRLYLTEQDCQTAINNMPGWIGMGNPASYRPLPLQSPFLTNPTVQDR